MEYEVESILKAFDDFDNYVNIINSGKLEAIYDGYLINLENFERLREKLHDYDIKNKYLNNSDKEKFKLAPEDSGEDFIIQINCGFQFIIINNDLCNKICIHNNHIIKYKINSKKIFLYTENDLEMTYKNNKNNIISKKSLLNGLKMINNIKDNLDKVYIDLINYFENGKKVENLLKNENNKGEEYKGLLVDMDWIDKWKKYSNYDSIKSKYLLKNNYDINKITNMVKKNQENLNLNSDEVDKIEGFIVKNVTSLEKEENFNKSFKILDLEFIKSFHLNSKINPTIFFISYKKIQIMNQGQPFLTFETSKNVIFNNDKNGNNVKINSIKVNSRLKKNNNINNSMFLKHIIRNNYLYKEFLSGMKLFINEFTEGYLIKDEIFDLLNEKSNLNYIITYIEKNPEFNDITYQNFNQKFSLILKYIKESHSDYFNFIRQCDIPGEINFTKDEGFFTLEYLNNQQNLQYYDDFKIIDKEFAFYLTQKFGDKINIPAIHFAIKEKVFFLIINQGKNDIYEFASLNSNYSFRVKYLIEFIHFYFVDMDLLKNSLLNFFLHNEMDKIISLGNPINVEDNKIIFNIYPIKISLKCNIKDKKNGSSEMNLNINFKNTNQNEKISNTYIQTNQYSISNEINTEESSRKNNENGIKYKYAQISSLDYKNGNNISELSYQFGYLIDKNICKSILNKINNEKLDNNFYNENPTILFGFNNNIAKTNINQIKFDSIFKDNNQSLYYPIDFDIIEQTKFNQIQYLIKENIAKISIEEINLIEYNQYCILIPKNNNFINENNHLIYLYSIQEEKIDKSKSYEPIAIFECNCKNINKRDKLFRSITQFMDLGTLIQNPKFLGAKLKCNCYLIEKNSNYKKIDVNPSPNIESKINDIQNLQNNKQVETNDEKNLEKYLRFAIKLIKERINIIKIIDQPFEYNDKTKLNYYLIHKNYMNKLYEIFCINTIGSIMNQYLTENVEEILNILKTNIPQNIKMEINSLNKNDIQKELSSKEIYYITKETFDNNHIKGLLYYKDCEIISKEMINLLEEIDKNIKNFKSIEINCVFDKNKIIVYKKGIIINIFNYKNGNLYVEYVIYSQSLDLLFTEFIKKGFKFIKKYFSSPIINIPIINNDKTYNITVYISKLTFDGKIEFNISDKLKVLILLSLSQYNFSNNELQEVYLLNPYWLSQYKYEQIESLIDFQQFKEIQNINSFESIPTIINYLNKEKLIKIDNEIVSIIANPSIPFNSKLKELIIKDKYFLLYKKFVLVNQQIYLYFQNYFGIISSMKSVYYAHKKGEGDLIIMEEYPLYNKLNKNEVENLCIFGKYNKKEKIFVIKYIFSYNNANILKNELTYILNYNIEYYVQHRIIFDKNKKYNYISPIIENHKKIGNYYKYIEGFDYNKCDDNNNNNNINNHNNNHNNEHNNNNNNNNHNNNNDYNNNNNRNNNHNINSNYLNNKQLINLIYLYTNKFYLKTIINNSNTVPYDEEFYLVKKNFLIDLRKENNYKSLENIFNGKIKNIPQNDEDIKKIVNKLSKNDLKLFDNMDMQNNFIQNDPTTYEIEITSITNPNNSSESFMIYKNFKLIEKKCSQIILKNKNQIPYDKLICSFCKNNMIIFHYPKHKLNQQNYICIISKIDEKTNFSNEYLLKYNDKNSYQYHIEKIKKDLNTFLQSINFMNNIAPIVRSEYLEIGTIIKINNKDDTALPPIPPPPPQPFPDESTRKNFPSKPLIGLQNIGATCYMNATLQCLCIIEKFVDYLKYNKQLYQIVINDKKNEKLCSSFKTLIENLYPNEDKQRKGSYAPRDFKDKISKMNPLFEGIAANDAKDLVNFLIMTLHMELNNAPQNQIDDNNGNIFEDQRNKELMFQNFTKSFNNSNQSIISELFYALNYNMTQCGNCKTITYNYQIYFFLIIPLEEVRKFKLTDNNNLQNNFMNNEVDIYDCFNYERKINLMTGDNAMYCNYCKLTCNCMMCTNLATGPEILIIILNRGKGIQFKVKINFYTELNLSNYIELQNTGTKYELFGVITHIGESGMSGHFIAYCKEYWNNQWLKFNDAIVEPVKDFKSEVIDYAMPYLLFYKKINN